MEGSDTALSSGSSELSEDSTNLSSSEVCLRVKKGPGLLQAPKASLDQERWSLIDLYGEVADDISVSLDALCCSHLVLYMSSTSIIDGDMMYHISRHFATDLEKKSIYFIINTDIPTIYSAMVIHGTVFPELNYLHHYLRYASLSMISIMLKPKSLYLLHLLILICFVTTYYCFPSS